MPTISVGSDKYLIDTGRALAQIDGPNIIGDSLAVRNLLRQCAGDYFSMQCLRNLVMDVHCADRVNLQDDVAVIELVARLVRTGRLHLLDLAPPPTSVRKFLTWDSVVPVAPRPTPPPPRAPGESPAPSFSSALDAALLAAALLAAALNGTPFCEECERPAAAST